MDVVADLRDDPQWRGGRLRSTRFKPVDALADEVELQGIATRGVGNGHVDWHVDGGARAEWARQPRACVIAVGHFAAALAELRAEANEADFPLIAGEDYTVTLPPVVDTR